MRIIRIAFLMLFIVFTSVAQTRISASEILRQINEGKNVSYNNVDIDGDLDLTDLKNRRNSRSSFNWFGSNNDYYESTVEGSISFVNCTFLGDVIAYYHHEGKNDTYVAHFDKDVVFKNCTFKRASEFKYSEFSGKADFSGSTFNRDANFKYAEFSEGPAFANTRFEEEANFKYAEFPRNTSFQQATFYGLANFKYSKFRTPLNINSIAFKGSEDFKYTKVDGRSFTSYLLENR
jgi:hypothetical protein